GVNSVLNPSPQQSRVQTTPTEPAMTPPASSSLRLDCGVAGGWAGWRLAAWDATRLGTECVRHWAHRMRSERSAGGRSMVWPQPGQWTRTCPGVVLAGGASPLVGACPEGIDSGEPQRGQATLRPAASSGALSTF